MRYAMLLLVLLGCGPANGAPPSKETIVEALDRYDALAVKRDEAMAGKVEGLAETVGNQTAELNAVKEELKGVKTGLKAIENLLTVEGEISIKVPKAADPPAEAAPTRADAPPASASDRRILFNGKPIDVNAWLHRSVKTVEISNRMSIDEHLRDHGLEGDFSRFSRAQKIQLHSCAHASGVPLKSAAPRKVVAKSMSVVLPQASNCPNGNCQKYGTVQERYRLFGGRR